MRAATITEANTARSYLLPVLITLFWSALLIIWQNAAFPDCYYNWALVGSGARQLIAMVGAL
jgi:hypothetical protein